MCLALEPLEDIEIDQRIIHYIEQHMMENNIRSNLAVC